MWIYFAIPIGWTLLIIVASTFYKKLCYTVTIHRANPPEGLADDAARVRFIRTEPTIARKTWQARIKPLWWGLWFAGLVVIFTSYFNLALGIGAGCTLLGLALFLQSRRKKAPVQDGIRWSIRNNFYGVM